MDRAWSATLKHSGAAVALEQCGVELNGLAVVELPQGLVEHVARILNSNLHVAQLLLNHLQLGDGLAEGDTLVGILRSILKSGLSKTDLFGYDEGTLTSKFFMSIMKPSPGSPMRSSSVTTTSSR